MGFFFCFPSTRAESLRASNFALRNGLDRVRLQVAAQSDLGALSPSIVAWFLADRGACPRYDHIRPIQRPEIKGSTVARRTPM